MVRVPQEYKDDERLAIPTTNLFLIIQDGMRDLVKTFECLYSNAGPSVYFYPA